MANIMTNLLNTIIASAKYYEEKARPEEVEEKSASDWQKIVIGDVLGTCSIIANADGKSSFKEISIADNLLGTNFAIDRFFDDYSIIPDTFFNLFFRSHVEEVTMRFENNKLPVSVENYINMYYHAQAQENGGAAELTQNTKDHFESILGDYLSAITVVATVDKKLKQSELDIITKFGSIFGQHVSKTYGAPCSFDVIVAAYIENLKKKTKYYPNK